MSLLATLLRPKSFKTPSTIAVCTNTGRRGAQRRGEEYHSGRQHGVDSISGRHRPRHQRQQSIEDVFIRSLVSAGTCRDCSNASRRTRQTHFLDKGLRRSGQSIVSKRAFSSNRRHPGAEVALQEEEEEGSEVPRKSYEDLVDTYDSRSLREKKSKQHSQHLRLAPRLTVTPEQESRPPFGKRVILDPIDENHREKIRRLKDLLDSGPGNNTNKTWRAYFDLPTPRLRYISDRLVGRLFQHFAWVEVRDLESSQRYFSLIEDALGERVPMRAGDWNTAITYAGLWVRKVTSDDVKAAIETWLRMEREGGVSADNVTFNILFDIAVKAERFALADTIHAEMDRRGLKLDRYFRTSKIYYAGKRGDGENVRAAFRGLVAAGEIVDTAIMNCVILSLVRCGEVASAENVMGKMKHLHEKKFGTASLRDWRDRKQMGRRLDRAARQLRDDNAEHLSSFFGSVHSHDDKKEEIQRSAPIAPDELTFRILIQYHAITSGNLEKVRTYLEEVHEAGYKVHHNLFYALFLGFFRHGGYAFTAWNRKSLEAYWEEYLGAVTGDAATKEMTARLNKRLKKSASAAENHAVHPLDPSDSLASSSEEANDDTEDRDEKDADPPPSHLAPTEFRASTISIALAAFYKCAGLKRMFEVWDEVQDKWPGMSLRDRKKIQSVVDEKVREAGVYLDR